MMLEHGPSLRRPLLFHELALGAFLPLLLAPCSLLLAPCRRVADRRPVVTRGSAPFTSISLCAHVSHPWTPTPGGFSCSARAAIVAWHCLDFLEALLAALVAHHAISPDHSQRRILGYPLRRTLYITPLHSR